MGLWRFPESWKNHNGISTLNHPSHGWPWLRIDTYGVLGYLHFRKYVYGCYDEKYDSYDCTIYIYIYIATPKNLKKTKTIKRHTLIVVMFHGAFGIDFTYNKVWKPMVLEHPESSYVDLILLWSMDWLVLGKYRKPSVFPLNMGYIYIYGYMGLSCKCSLKPIHWYGCLLKTLQRFLISQACNLWRWLSDAVAKSGARRMGRLRPRNEEIQCEIMAFSGIYYPYAPWMVYLPTNLGD